jgi:CRISPR-associated protein Cas4
MSSTSSTPVAPIVDAVPAVVVSADEPALRVMSLHALAYCDRLFYLEEVEEIRVADERVYAGRELHAGLEAAEGEEKTSFELESQTLGLKGKIDCLRRRDGSIVPYEHKRGRPRREEEGKNRGGTGIPTAWPSDRLQVAAYAMLLEEAIGAAISEARIHYHAENVTVRVKVDDAARAEVHLRLIGHASYAARWNGRPLRITNDFARGVRWLRSVCRKRSGKIDCRSTSPVGCFRPTGMALACTSCHKVHWWGAAVTHWSSGRVKARRPNIQLGKLTPCCCTGAARFPRRPCACASSTVSACTGCQPPAFTRPAWPRRPARFSVAFVSTVP